MRVVVVGPRWRARWTESVGRALAGLGHDASILEYPEPVLLDRSRSYPVPPWLRRPALALAGAVLERRRRPHYEEFAAQLVSRVHETRPDLLLILRGEVVAPATVARLKREYGVRVATWWIDDPLRFPAAVAMGRECDDFFVFCRHCAGRLRDAGIRRAHYLPCAFDPLLYRPLDLAAADYPTEAATVSFVGAYYPRRGEILGAIGDHAPAIWGPGWRAASKRGEVRLPPGTIRGDDVPPETMARILALSTISLDIHHPQSRGGGLNMRAFEAAACGAFQLVDAIPDTEDLFRTGEELVFYQDVDHLRRLLAHYLAAPAEAAAIAARAQARALGEHTVRHRMEALLATLA